MRFRLWSETFLEIILRYRRISFKISTRIFHLKVPNYILSRAKKIFELRIDFSVSEICRKNGLFEKLTNLNWPSIPVVGPLSKILVCVHSSPGWYSTFVRPSRQVIGCCCTIWGFPSDVKVPGFNFYCISKRIRWLIINESLRYN